MTREELIEKHYEAYEAALTETRPELVTRLELDKAVPEKADELDDQIQKALALLIKAKLDADPSMNQRFVATTNVPRWNQLLLAARSKELARSRIVVRGGRYDVADLAKTFSGRALLSETGLKLKTNVDRGELDMLAAACAKLELTLPETIEPTTTEVFFAS